MTVYQVIGEQVGKLLGRNDLEGDLFEREVKLWRKKQFLSVIHALIQRHNDLVIHCGIDIPVVVISDPLKLQFLCQVMLSHIIDYDQITDLILPL